MTAKGVNDYDITICKMILAGLSKSMPSTVSVKAGLKQFLSVLTIALAVALLSGFALSVIGMETEAKRELLVSSQMLYHNLNDEQMQTLRHDERISDSKIYMQAGQYAD